MSEERKGKEKDSCSLSMNRKQSISMSATSLSRQVDAEVSSNVSRPEHLVRYLPTAPEPSSSYTFPEYLVTRFKTGTAAGAQGCKST